MKILIMTLKVSKNEKVLAEIQAHVDKSNSKVATSNKLRSLHYFLMSGLTVEN